MIKLTHINGRTVWVNTERIMVVTNSDYNDGGTDIYFDARWISVIESPEVVIDKLTDYKLSIIQYKAEFQAESFYVSHNMRRPEDYPFVNASGIREFIRSLAGLYRRQ